ncbi:hypothetical protein PanWU01x14_022390 [Parasponia andersonii]|uniref:Uncharacterized protein n=1 Tax=Parasponia andersonii TaxID=3476 RepID=A0A2P5DX68_PARAD|nr:hypothetical protein PanWU01x14_022390 [Parasponia andersonii]
MAESQKESSSVSPKEKKSLLDDDIGKEFLSSWKSMSVAEDDTMDFNFSTVSSGRKKAFDFEKLDMDFNLDGDFNKLSSFKVDMSDFDFSSPSKKVVKTKERTEQESSTRNQQGKNNQFDFSFDFNELDSFNFDSSLLKEEKASNKNQDGKKDIYSDGNESRSSKSQLSEGIKALDDTMVTKLQACEDVVTSKVQILLAGSGHLKSIENDNAKYVTAGASIVSHGAGLSPEKVMTNREDTIDQQSHSSEKEISSELYSKKAIVDFSGQSSVGIDSKGAILSDGQTESSEKGTGIQTTSSPKDVNEKMMAGEISYHENLPFKDSLTHNTTSGSNFCGTNKLVSDISKETVDGTVSVAGNLNIEENFTSFVSRKAQPDVKDSKEKQDLTAEIPSAVLCRELTKGKDVLQEGAKNVKNLRNVRDSFISDGLLNGSKLVGTSLLCVEEATDGEPVMPASNKNVKDQNIGLQVHPSSSCEKETKSSTQTSVNSKLFVSSKESVRDPKIKFAEESKVCLAKGGRKVPDLSTLNISETTGANKVLSYSAPKKDVNSLQNLELTVQIQSNTASETASVIGAEKKLPLNFSLKRKTFELSNSDLATLKPLKRLSRPLTESSDFREPLKGVVEEKFCSAETSLISDTEKSLKPLKGLSESLGGSRDFTGPLKRVDAKEPLKIVDEEKVENKTSSILYDSPASALESPREVNMMELEISSIMENDRNVEKAEAYTKELDELSLRASPDAPSPAKPSCLYFTGHAL